jgi:hypothetical protein
MIEFVLEHILFIGWQGHTMYWPMWILQQWWDLAQPTQKVSKILPQTDFFETKWGLQYFQAVMYLQTYY